ncbi:TfoX/Sxy family protein [Georgenia subflava]|uniref:RNA methyltransferase n=1 Tax=Georgenia subflava TaxID=1622177 RepID=A0A6N7EFZ1_9MICO|nr:TfoX/Sxy family protein [Georgenia subflava]MPV36311.1 RNA methyltransferase [Georgenia subflava]
MPYSDVLAQRIRQMLEREPGVREKRMFGGLGFLVEGNLAVSASSAGGMMVRADPAEIAALLDEPHVGLVEMRGHRMTGWVRIAPDGLESDDELRRWVRHGLTRARTLPPK